MNADGSDYAEIYAVFLFHARDLRGADGVEEQFNLTAYYGKWNRDDIYDEIWSH